MFGLCFLGASYPIPASGLQQVDATHYVLDVCSVVKPDYSELKEVALFLTSPPPDPSMAVALYVRSGQSEWLYRGAVHAGHPSDALPLQWPRGADGELAAPGPGAAQVGVSLEPIADVAGKEGSRLGDKLDYSRRVAGDFVRFMQSYPTQGEFEF